jgi:hypothetical protein
MTSNNPLQKYFRQAKLFLSLPSKGLFYPPGVLKGDYNNMPVFGMTGQDELILKAPDALYNGESTVQVIQSCCPYISDARQMPSIDVDAVLAAIRIATYGEILNVYHICEHCSAENDYEFNLTQLIDFYNNKKYYNKIQLNDLTINIRPLNYGELSELNVEQYKIQKTIQKISSNPDAQPAELEALFASLADLRGRILLTSIDTVQAPDGVVSEPEFISEWVANSEKNLYDAINNLLDKNKDEWSVSTQTAQCGSCGGENKFSIVLDQTNFFGKRS